VGGAGPAVHGWLSTGGGRVVGMDDVVPAAAAAAAPGVNAGNPEGCGAAAPPPFSGLFCV
jgi:hypothetical protein